MYGSNPEGRKALAEYLRVVQEARWARLPPEVAAEEAWPHFRKAVVVALREGTALRGAPVRWTGTTLPFDDPHRVESPATVSGA